MFLITVLLGLIVGLLLGILLTLIGIEVLLHKILAGLPKPANGSLTAVQIKLGTPIQK